MVRLETEAEYLDRLEREFQAKDTLHKQEVERLNLPGDYRDWVKGDFREDGYRVYCINGVIWSRANTGGIS